MTTIDPVWATVAELSRAFGARTLSPVDAVEALLERIRRRNPSLHAFIAVYEADAGSPRRAPIARSAPGTGWDRSTACPSRSRI